MKSLLPFCNNLENALKHYLSSFCPCCFWLLCTEHEEHKKLKAVAGFLYGIVLGLVIYLAILIDLEFGKITTLCIATFITLFLALGNAFSTQIRCATLLILPSFCGKSGRGVLKTIVLAYVLGGPFMTISNNAKEAVRVFGCTTTLSYNLTKTKHDLMVKPFQDALYQIKHDVREVTETLQSVRDIVQPLIEEVEGRIEVGALRKENDDVDNLQGDFKRSKEIEEKYKIPAAYEMKKRTKISSEMYEREYKRKLEYRCQNVISKGTLRCRALFQNSYTLCNQKVSVVVSWLLCWPMKLNYICNLAQVFGGQSVCDPSKEVRSGFGEGYETLKNLGSAMGRNFKNIVVQFEVKNPEPQINVKTAGDVSRKIIKTFAEKKVVFDVVIIFIKRFLALIFLRVVYKAAQYHDQYLTNIEYDNKYITKYFRRIDDRRKKRGQRSLLPMKKIERQNFIDPYAIVSLTEERKRIVGQSFKLILEMITATTFILLDRLFFETLYIVSKHALIEYTQSGEHDMSIKVTGTGMIANLVRAIVEGFNFKRRVRVVHSNKRCLPRPIMLPNYYLYKIYGTYFFIWLFILLENYTQRLNRAICAYFYRKREKKRVLYLYNETLKRRIGFFKYMKNKIRRQAKEISLSFEANVLLAFRLRNRKKFDWLRYLPMGKRKCLICGEPEPTKLNVFYECSTPGCNFVHCIECWRDVGEICYGCHAMDSDDTAFEDEDFMLYGK